MPEFRSVDFRRRIVQKDGCRLAIERWMAMSVHRCALILGMAGTSIRVIVQLHLLGQIANGLGGIGPR